MDEIKQVKIPLLLYQLAVQHKDHHHAERWLNIVDMYYHRGCTPISSAFVENYCPPGEKRTVDGLYPIRAYVTAQWVRWLAARGYILRPDGKPFTRLPEHYENPHFIPNLFTEELADALR